jgi:hypothetical protein
LRLSKLENALHEDITELEIERAGSPKAGENTGNVERFIEANTMTGVRESSYFGDIS